MLQFDDVALSFSGEPLFENATFQLQRGEKCSLVGRNGSGKSTLLKMAAGLIEPDQGSISVPKGYRIGYLEQHIRFTQNTVREEAAQGLAQDEKEHLYKAERILFGLGFTKEDLEKAPTSFSGGYQLRLHLAKVLVSNPDCLLLDEPTNYLDILSIRFLERFLKEWKGELVIISHEREFLDAISSHVIGIHRKKVKKIKGNTIAFFEQILLEEEVHEKTRLKTEKKHAKMESFIERFGAKATKASQAQSRKKMLEREPVLEKLNFLENLSFHFPEAPFPGKKMVEADGIHFSYTHHPLISNLNITIEKGQKIAIIGKNGRGKSTILSLLAEEHAPQKGRLFLSENVRLGYFGQTHIENLFPDHTIEEEISRANKNLAYSQVKAIAGKMLFSGDLSQKKISVLSGGEKSRVLLAKILASPSNLLLLDEPTHHLDIESVEALIDALENFSGTVVIVTHSELILRRLELDQLIVCEEKEQLVFLGNYDLFLEKRGWEEERKTPPKEKALQPMRKSQNAFLEKKIRDCEEKIAELENAQKLGLASLESGNLAPQLLKEISKREKELEHLFMMLEKLHAEYRH